jgi:flagellar biosynthesis/type III secretory pathway protein FliH
MSSSIVINSNVLAFVPASSHEPGYEPTELGPSSFDTQELERQLRAELEAEYQQRLEREVEARLVQERSHFDTVLAQSMAGFDAMINSLRKDIQANVVDMSLRLSEVIVRHELPDREMLRNLIVKTLEPISDLQGAMVRISSNDWKLFGEEISNGDHLGVGSTVKFAEDPNLVAGDVIVESRNGIFDARLKERLKLLKETLHERSGRKAPESPEL